MNAPRLPDRGGFGLLEMIVAIVIFSIVFGTMMGLVFNVQRSYGVQRIAVRQEEALRAAQLVIGTALRTVEADPMRRAATLFPGGSGLFPDPDGNGVFDDVRVVADFNPGDGAADDLLEDILIRVSNDTLYARWQAGGAATAAAYPIRSLRFEYFSKDGTQLTTPTLAAESAARISFTLDTPADGIVPRNRQVKSWIYLRNRQ